MDGGTLRSQSSLVQHGHDERPDTQDDRERRVSSPRPDTGRSRADRVGVRWRLWLAIEVHREARMGRTQT